jgi:hypothetical protein
MNLLLNWKVLILLAATFAAVYIISGFVFFFAKFLALFCLGFGIGQWVYGKLK